ncbi:hypothetical protein DEGR_22140 [Deinococcus grandis]|nr:hypothetical protein DEGR_22140 [Deinococcus grandis]
MEPTTGVSINYDTARKRAPDLLQPVHSGRNASATVRGLPVRLPQTPETP